MPRRPCLEAGCPNYATYRGRCAEHSAHHERTRNKAGRDIYNTKRWKMTRRRKLNMDPICEQCKNELATDVHHKKGVKVVTWEIEALESLCHSCHSRVTRQEECRARYLWVCRAALARLKIGATVPAWVFVRSMVAQRKCGASGMGLRQGRWPH